MKLARSKYNKPSSRQFFDHTISHMQGNTTQTKYPSYLTNVERQVNENTLKNNYKAIFPLSYCNYILNIPLARNTFTDLEIPTKQL